MGHKTKEDRQREARERVIERELPHALKSLTETMQRIQLGGGDGWDRRNIVKEAREATRKLELKHECSTKEAVARLRTFLANTNEGAFVSGPDTVEEAVQQFLDRVDRKRGVPTQTAMHKAGQREERRTHEEWWSANRGRRA